MKNNPNKHHPDINSTQKPSEDPTGFIYPTYRAAEATSNRYQAVRAQGIGVITSFVDLHIRKEVRL